MAFSWVHKAAVIAALLLLAEPSHAQTYRGNASPYRPRTWEEEYFNRAVPPVPLIPHNGGNGFYLGGYFLTDTRDIYTACVSLIDRMNVRHFCVEAYRRLCSDENEFDPNNMSCLLLRRKLGWTEPLPRSGEKP
jgi:hypothetical protein